MLTIEGLTKRYGSYTAIDQLDLDVREGMIFGLLGPNGAGKTTLLRVVMGLMPTTSGKITLFDDYQPGDPEVSKLVGYMPQRLAVYPTLSVEENVRFFGRLYGLAEPELGKRTAELIAMVGLEGRRDNQVGGLSGGEARRAMLASTLIHRPRLLILDEPTAGVDPLLRVRFWEWFGHLVEMGTSIIITTHHISEASHCQRVVFLRDGVLLADATPQDLMAEHGVSDLEAAFVRVTERREASA